MIVPEFRIIVRPSILRARGMPGDQRTRSLACNKESTRASHRRFAEDTRHSPHANGFNAYSTLFPAIGLFCHRHRRNAKALSPA
jgi:hypothetical protein